MKKATITMTYNEERLNAIRLFLTQKNLELDTELDGFFDSLFKKIVPPDVRRFLEMKDGSTPDNTSSPTRRSGDAKLRAE
ncbi:MAG TPA: hypothetical protein DEP23_14755 [Ruminococcaceae bacterium]|nr:hypothetical protein [Oscillospiraceae bacterium]